jgi:signal peptidase I
VTVAFYGSGHEPRIKDDPWAPLLIPLSLITGTLLVVFFVVFNYTTVVGDSMVPTLLPGDRLLLTKSYIAPQRGDIVVFTLKEEGKDVDVVKRVVGVPGDVVVTVGDFAWVNNKPDHKIEEGGGLTRFGPVEVPPGKVFVLGDNRPISFDSRYVGFIPLKDMKGKAVAVYAPIQRVRRLD